MHAVKSFLKPNEQQFYTVLSKECTGIGNLVIYRCVRPFEQVGELSRVVDTEQQCIRNHTAIAFKNNGDGDGR